MLIAWSAGLMWLNSLALGPVEPPGRRGICGPALSGWHRGSEDGVYMNFTLFWG